MKVNELLKYLEMAFPNSSDKDENDEWYVINVGEYYINIAFKINQENTDESR